MKQNLRLPNPQGELLDVLVEGNPQASDTIIFVHGFGTDKHEYGLFDDVSAALKDNYRTVRFDFSGYGQSQGSQVEANYHKHTGDLSAIITWVQANFPSQLHLIAQSAGCLVSAWLCPDNIHTAIMESIPNANAKLVKRNFIAYHAKRGSKINESGITRLTRSTGAIQQIGPTFWQALDSLNIPHQYALFAPKTNLHIIHPTEDEIIGSEALDFYRDLKNAHYHEIPGNHSYTDPTDRQGLIDLIKSLLPV